MKVIEYDTEYSQNSFGNRTGNRVRKKGIYRCYSCGEEAIIWLDYGRLPGCPTCRKEVEWEYQHSKIEDVYQTRHGRFALFVK